MNAQTITNAISSLIQMQCIKPFDKVFDESPISTLSYIDAIDDYVLINNITDHRLQFKSIFCALSDGVRCLYWMDHPNRDGNALNVDNLKDWLLKKYPPPRTKHKFMMNLNQTILRHNECPRTVYDRVKHKFTKIDAAIDRIKKHDRRLLIGHLTDEQKVQVMHGIFVRRNCKKNLKNNGKINEKLLELVEDADPHTMQEYDALFDGIRKKLVPFCRTGSRDYDFETYPTNESDFSIYTITHKHNKPAAAAQEQKSDHYAQNDQNAHIAPVIQRQNKRRLNEYDDEFGEEYDEEYGDEYGDEYADEYVSGKRRRGNDGDIIANDPCARCGHSTHLRKNCVARRHINGSKLSTKNNPRCYACGERGHKANSCPYEPPQQTQQPTHPQPPNNTNSNVNSNAYPSSQNIKSVAWKNEAHKQLNMMIQHGLIEHITPEQKEKMDEHLASIGRIFDGNE